MIEKYLRKKITRTDLEKRVLEKSLRSEYAKLGGVKEASAIETTPKDSSSIKTKEIKTNLAIDTTKKKIN